MSVLRRPVLVGLIVTGVLCPGVALAAEPVGGPAAPNTPQTAAQKAAAVRAQASTAAGNVRVAHLSPDTANVDIYFTAYSGGTTELMSSGTGYGEVGPYQRVPEGVYTVALKSAGASAGTPSLMRFTVDVKKGEAYTVAAVGRGAQRKGAVLRDDLTPPKAGNARVRLIQASSAAPKVDLLANSGTVLAADAAFGTATGYAQVKAGTLPLTAAGGAQLTARRNVSVAAGSVTSIVVLDSPNGLTLRSIQDAGGTSAMPAGGVDTGGGGTATRSGDPAVPATAGILAGLAASVLAAVVWRGRRRSHRFGA